MKLLKINRISELEDIEYDLDIRFTLPSKNLGTNELTNITTSLSLDFTTHSHMLLAYNRTAMFVHAFNLLTNEVDIKHAGGRFFIVKM